MAQRSSKTQKLERVQSEKLTVREQPVNAVVWRHRDTLSPNNYNPNSVAPPEMNLLRISILEDGWTQPIVINPDFTIVDGFHRYMVSGMKEIYEQTEGMVPTVMISPQRDTDQMMSTIRHNRARGTHSVLKMADIIQEMVERKLPMDEICTRLQMESDEVIRLASKKGIPISDIVATAEWSKAWKPQRT